MELSVSRNISHNHNNQFKLNFLNYFMAENYSLEKVREIVAITRESTYLEGRLEIFQGGESPQITLDKIVPLRDGIKSLLSKMVEFPEVFSQNIQSYSQLVSLVDEETEGYLN